MYKIAKATTYIIVAALALAVAACSPPAAKSQFEGSWTVADTSGSPFVITLGDDGSAAADRSGEAMEGTWKEEDGAAVISWTDGWTTKIVKEGDGYKKLAWDKGVAVDSPPSNTSTAAKAP
jgi:hypothetical protein